MLRRIRSALFGGRDEVTITPVKSGSGWLKQVLQPTFDPAIVDISAVRARAEETRRLGEQPLWEGYREVKDYPYATSGNRTSDQVRTTEDLGAFYAWLVSIRKPELIVEFGTAFGISGMFWLTGLNMAGGGRLLTYEPNAVWADIAEKNLAAISDRFVLNRGMFEHLAAQTLAANSVDIAFIDAIHTSEFVHAQYDILKPYLKRDALVFFDDINFSPDMRQCWRELAVRPEVVASFEIGKRAGLVELRLDDG